MMGYLLYGFPKCGQHSIIKKYEDEGNNILSYEGCWRSDALQHYERNWPDYKLIFVRRNIYDFLLSSYNFWPEGYDSGISFKEFLHIKPDTFNDNHWGIQNPIERADFDRWIKPFEKYNPIIINIDDEDDFPHEFENKNKKKTGLTGRDIFDIQEALLGYYEARIK